MFSWITGTAPVEKQKEETKDYGPYPELGKEYNADHCFDELIMFFEGRDKENWAV